MTRKNASGNSSAPWPTRHARPKSGQAQPPGGYTYPSGPPGPLAPPPPPSPWTYGGTFSGPPPKSASGNRMWWILGTVIVIGVSGPRGGHRRLRRTPAFRCPVDHQLPADHLRDVWSAVEHDAEQPRPVDHSDENIDAVDVTTPPPGGRLSVSGINENRTIACNDNIVSVSGISNTVVITGHCTSLTVSGVQNSITVDAVDTIDASGFNNKITYHSGTPKISNSGDSNVVQQG